METIGSYLKNLREEQNLTLEKLQEDTKMTILMLSCIENDRLDKLGAYGYAKAMVYTVIRALNADENKALSMFEAAYPSENTTIFKPRKPIKENKILISTNFLYLAGIVLLIIVLGIIVIKAYDTYNKTPNAQNSIFHRTKIQAEETKAVQPTRTVVKPDTVRMKLLQVKKNVISTPVKPTSAKVKTNTASLADTTDYVNDLLFHNQDNPLNIRN